MSKRNVVTTNPMLVEPGPECDTRQKYDRAVFLNAIKFVATLSLGGGRRDVREFWTPNDAMEAAAKMVDAYGRKAIVGAYTAGLREMTMGDSEWSTWLDLWKGKGPKPEVSHKIKNKAYFFDTQALAEIYAFKHQYPKVWVTHTALGWAVRMRPIIGVGAKLVGPGT